MVLRLDLLQRYRGDRIRVVFLGGTGFLGPVAVQRLSEAGHEVVIAHTGTHEVPGQEHLLHVHGERSQLLGVNGPIERLAPDVLVDTRGARDRGEAVASLVDYANRCRPRQIISISSGDVYRYTVEIGIGDGSGLNLLPVERLPIREDSPVRTTPYPGGNLDNAVMEAALKKVAVPVTVLRPGMMYGVNDPIARESHLVSLVRQGIRRLELPDGGGQFCSRVAVERVALAIEAAIDRAPTTWWACNVVDPYGWTYAGLATIIGQLLGWTWDPVVVPFETVSHPFQLSHPLFVSDDRLRTVLGVSEPDPEEALAATVAWLWNHSKSSDAHV